MLLSFDTILGLSKQTIDALFASVLAVNGVYHKYERTVRDVGSAARPEFTDIPIRVLNTKKSTSWTNESGVVLTKSNVDYLIPQSAELQQATSKDRITVEGTTYQILRVNNIIDAAFSLVVEAFR